jgi:bifunctional DNA-binding transcriptional regulator/antitoxin component of YhaV-PrlF toxin-antitoxin module
VRRELGLQAGDAFQVRIDAGRIVLEPIEVTPVERYSEMRIREFLESAEMSEEELARAREAWGL